MSITAILDDFVTEAGDSDCFSDSDRHSIGRPCIAGWRDADSTIKVIFSDLLGKVSVVEPFNSCLPRHECILHSGFITCFCGDSEYVSRGGIQTRWMNKLQNYQKRVEI